MSAKVVLVWNSRGLALEKIRIKVRCTGQYMTTTLKGIHLFLIFICSLFYLGTMDNTLENTIQQAG